MTGLRDYRNLPGLVRQEGEPRPLEEIVAEWRLAAAAGDEARPWACGTVVIAAPADPTAGVRAHQRTDRHRRWAAGRFE
jgi:hypothetical protein